MFIVLICLLFWGGCSFAAGLSDLELENGGGSVNFLFIHHSCGGQLLAENGPNSGDSCIYVSHPNGGGLRAELESLGYVVNEASYGSIIGADTDICHWNKKFRENMDRIAKTKNQDELLPEGTSNQIVAFKSCFPNNQFVGAGVGSGDPNSCELTVANAKASYRALLPYFENHPDILFIAFSAPPLAKAVGLKGFIKRLVKGKARHPEWARSFNSWLVDKESGWLANYPKANVFTFDYYDILTNYGETNWSAFPIGGGDDHPSSEGNLNAAKEFLPFLEEAVQMHRSGLK